jgi:hypothetical protein
MPNLEVLAPPVVDTPLEILKFETSVDQIKVIGYEYLALIYYFFRGWL